MQQHKKEVIRMSTMFARKTAHGTDWISPETLLYERRQVFFTGPVTAESSHQAIVRMAALDQVSHEPISLVIDSPGGDVHAGLALIDCMQGIESPVHTKGIGLIASMGAVILACGAKGERTMAPHASLLVHQPIVTGMGGQASDMEIAVKSTIRLKRTLNELLADAAGVSVSDIDSITDRDTWFTAQEAVEFGLADKVESKRFFEM